MAEVRVLSPIKFKGKIRAVGQRINLPDEIIDSLPAGRVELVAAAAAPEKPKK